MYFFITHKPFGHVSLYFSGKEMYEIQNLFKRGTPRSIGFVPVGQTRVSDSQATTLGRITYGGCNTCTP
jgi:hypothetical protein